MLKLRKLNINSIELINKLKEKPVFKLQDIQRIKSCNKRYALQILNRLNKRGIIKRVTKNAYTTKTNINIIATHLTYPSYISFWYASYYLGFTKQILDTVQIATTKKKKPIKFENYRIKFIPIKYFFRI